MHIEDEIRSKTANLQELCKRLGVAGLRARVDADAWTEVTFIGDIDTSQLVGYADRFFGLEEGLTSIFHRRVRLLDEEMESKQKLHSETTLRPISHEIELLRAS